MNPLASCPSCARSLGRFEANGYFRATCSTCRLQMEGFWGRVAHWQSKGEPVFYLAPALPKLFRRRYQIRITTPGRELKQLQFTSPGLDDQMPTRTRGRFDRSFDLSGVVGFRRQRNRESDGDDVFPRRTTV